MVDISVAAALAHAPSAADAALVPALAGGMQLAAPAPRHAAATTVAFVPGAPAAKPPPAAPPSSAAILPGERSPSPLSLALPLAFVGTRSNDFEKASITMTFIFPHLPGEAF